MTGIEYNAIRVGLTAEKHGNLMSKETFVKSLEFNLRFKLLEDGVHEELKCTTPYFISEYDHISDTAEICVCLGKNDYAKVICEPYNELDENGNGLPTSEFWKEIAPNVYKGPMDCSITFFNSSDQVGSIIHRKVSCIFTIGDSISNDERSDEE